MYKGTIATNVSATSGVNIPFTTSLNTNSGTLYDSVNNQVDILSPGYYNIYCQIVVTNTTDATISAQIYGDGTALAESIATENITASTGVTTLVMADAIKVQNTRNNTWASISIRLSADATISSGVLIVEKVR